MRSGCVTGCPAMNVPSSLTVLPFVFGTLASGAVTTIYQDDFSGTANANLGGTAPDIRPGTTQVWSADGSFDFSGTNSVSAIAHSSSRGAYLPFVPQQGFRYDYQVTIQFAAEIAEDRSLQMGFFSGQPSSGTGVALSGSASGPMIFLRNRGTYEARAVGSSSLTGFNGTVGATNVDNAMVFRIILDTSAPQWFMRAYIGGTEIGSGYTFPEGSNPTIQSVGFATNTSGTPAAAAVGNFSNFILTSEPIPEPSSLLLLAAGFPALFSRRRK